MEQKTNECDESSKAGIVFMESYFPKFYIDQTEFESYNNVSSGKYTIGLGQKEMSFVTDREDICSISLTVLSNLMRKNKIDYNDVGWVCVATETIIDHSKSVSSMLMQLFSEHGNHDVEGIDVKHACYGGTFALFSAFERVSSRYWDGRYCIVIAADIAEYDEGPARCTGGCGAIAMCIGSNKDDKNSPCCIELETLRSSYKAHAYDFYKPNLDSPFPVVDGHVSNACYINAVDACYQSYANKYEKQTNKTFRPCQSDIDHINDESNDYWIFHAPYNKIVSKSFGRIIYNDFLRNPKYYYEKYKDNETLIEFFKKYENVKSTDTVNTREVIKTFEKLSKPLYNECVSPSTMLPKVVGNCYTASLFMGLMSLIYQCKDDLSNKLLGKRIAVFSYGSGIVASLYTLKVNASSKSTLKQLNAMIENNDLQSILKQRIKVNCEEFTNIMNERKKVYHSKNDSDFVPQTDMDDNHFFEHTFCLSKMDSLKRRYYELFDGNEENKEKEEEEENVVETIKEVKIVLENPLLKHSNQLIESMKKKIHANDSISKKGAIKIDKVLNTAQQISSSCAYT